MRTVAGVIAGYLFFALASITLFVVADQQPHERVGVAFMLVSTIYGMVAAFIGALIACAIAKRPDQRASVWVAVIIALGALTSMATVPEGGSRAAMFAALLLMAPTALLGGVFYRKLRGLPINRPE